MAVVLRIIKCDSKVKQYINHAFHSKSPESSGPAYEALSEADDNPVKPNPTAGTTPVGLNNKSVAMGINVWMYHQYCVVANMYYSSIMQCFHVVYVLSFDHPAVFYQ
jgi:hypothetical protein